MKKSLRHIMIFGLAMLLSGTSVKVYAQDVKQGLETEQTAVTIQINSNSTLIIKNAEHQTVEVFSLTGEKVYTARIDAQNKQIELNNLAKGIYVVKVGKVTRKVYIK